MGYIIAILFVLLATVAKIYNSNWINPVTIFSLVWGIIVYLAYAQLYNINKVSDWVYFLILLGVVSFAIGCLMARKITFNLGASTSQEVNYILKDKIVLILLVVSTVIMAKIAINSLQLLFSGQSLEYIRAIYQAEGAETTGGMSVIESGLYSYICCPFMYAFIPYVFNEMFNGRAKKIHVFLTAIMTISFIIGCAGRLVLAYIAICAALCFRSQGKEKSLWQQIRVIVLIAALAIAFVEISRNRGTLDLGKSYYLYICGCVPHFELRANIVNDNGIVLYGLATIKGFILPFLSLLNATSIVKYPAWFQNALTYTTVQDRMPIGNNTYINAFVTSFYSLYVDGRFLLVAIGMIIYGFIAFKAYKKYIESPDISYYYCVYALILYGLATSMIRLQFTVTSYAFAYIILRLLFKKDVRCCHNEEITNKYPL